MADITIIVSKSRISVVVRDEWAGGYANIEHEISDGCVIIGHVAKGAVHTYGVTRALDAIYAGTTRYHPKRIGDILAGAANPPVEVFYDVCWLVNRRYLDGLDWSM